MILKERIIKKTRKVHECTASIWLRECALEEIACGNIKCTFSERRAIVKARQNNWEIPIGSSCIYSVGIWNGDFFACHYIPEIHDICVKYDIYEDF